MSQLVEALRYNPEGRGFDARWYHWNFSSFRSHYGPGVDSALTEICTRNISGVGGGTGGRCVRLTTFPPSYVDFLEI